MADEKFEIDYISKFTSFFNPAKFSSTYKLVFLKSMMDISEYVLDSQWRRFKIDGEIPMETKYGTYDMNSDMERKQRMI